MPNRDVFAQEAPGPYRQILETAPDAMIVVDSDGKIRFANAQTEKLFGVPRGELLGKALEVLVPDRFRKAHVGHVGRFFARPGARAMGSDLDLFGKRADGVEFPVEVSLSPVEVDGATMVSAAIRDVTERRRIEAAVKMNADRLASAVESIQDAIALFDAEDRLVLCNSVYRRLVSETTSGALVGRTYESILDSWLDTLAFDSPEERAQFRASRLAERREPRGALDVRTRDGRSLRITSRRTIEQGIVKTIWDLTDDVRREQELREAQAAAEAASEAKSEFLASMSHELRTPLNAILGFAQLLQRDKKEPLSERHKERVLQVLKGGEHLLRLIDDILDLARIEAGRVSISTEPVNVAEVVDEVTRTLGPFATRQQVSLAAAALPQALPMVAADRTRLVQILMNFGSNALKYNRANGSASFEVTTPSADRVRVAIHDSGLGIPSEKQEKLFHPFQRAGQETGPIEGTGIGLVISQRLARLMGGEVGFRSTAGVGSSFWVDLPALPTAAPVSIAEAVRDHSRAVLRGAAHRVVLYVEDNPANVSFMKDLVSSFESIDLLTAQTAEAGIEIAKTHRPEVIVMDINLPGMSGEDALVALRALPETSAIPVIALTAAASERDKRRGIEAGFHRYLTKPVNVDEFLGVLEALLSPEEKV